MFKIKINKFFFPKGLFSNNPTYNIKVDEDEEASSSASYNSNSQMKHSNEEAASKSNEDNQSEPDEAESKPKIRVKPKLKKPFKPNCVEPALANTNPSEAASSTKTWTCQLCKKQFDQRIDLSKHQCIELHLKLLKKKKELRKKKLREAHWKRKIDLSYIETTSLTQLPQNIADNLGFCIDGTGEDMKAYTREVKDYLSTELGHETEMEMFLKCCFPEYAESQSQSETVDHSVLRKANSYFIECVYSGADASKSNKSGHSSSHSAGLGNYKILLIMKNFIFSLINITITVLDKIFDKILNFFI